jgi:signal peptidase I
VLVAGAAPVLFHSGYAVKSMTGASMRPSYGPGERIVFAKGISHPSSGDVVLFTAPGWADLPKGTELVSRVVATGRDRIAYDRNGSLTRNGQLLEEPYLEGLDDGMAGSAPFNVTVPQGRLFLMGDNRANSNDSRYHQPVASGTVPESAVVGVAIPEEEHAGLLYVFGGAALGGLLLALAGAGLGIGARVARRRARERELAPPHVPNPSQRLGW